MSTHDALPDSTLRHRWFGTSATTSIGVIVTTGLSGTPVRAVTVTTRTPCATRFNTGAPGRLSPSSITIAAASGSGPRSEEHTTELQSLMRTSYAVFCLKHNNTQQYHPQ